MAHLSLNPTPMSAPFPGVQVVLALDLGTTTGWALQAADGLITSGTVSFRPSRYDGGGMRYLRFRGWLEQLAHDAGAITAIHFEEVRRHVGTDAAHVYGGLLATLTSWAETAGVAYQGVPVGTIKRHATGKGNANKDAMMAAARARGFSPADDNEADAIAILLWALETLPMKSLSPALQAHLDEATTTLGWCWRITRADGVTFGFTDHDRTLSFDGTEFEPASGLTASEVRSGSDLSVDAQDAEGVLTSDRITEIDIVDGRWDNAEVEVWRVNWADSSQRVLMRRGAIGQIRRGRLAFVAEVRSLAHVLGQTVGRTFQATCDAVLGDARCGVDLEDPAFKGAGAVIDLLRDRAFTASGLSGFTSGWFTFGTIEWSSGANAGRRAEVLGHDVTDGIAILTLLEAPVRAIAEGDGFTIRAGCDKRIETCGAKFANTANFRGFPHIPGQDTILRYATKDGGHDGSVL